RFVPLTTHHSTVCTAHHSPFTSLYHSPLTTHHSPLREGGPVLTSQTSGLPRPARETPIGRGRALGPPQARSRAWRSAPIRPSRRARLGPEPGAGASPPAPRRADSCPGSTAGPPGETGRGRSRGHSSPVQRPHGPSRRGTPAARPGRNLRKCWWSRG